MLQPKKKTGPKPKVRISCSRCGESPYFPYHRNKKFCHPCYNKTIRDYRASSLTNYRRTDTLRRRRLKCEDPKKVWAKNAADAARKRAKKRGLPCEIDRDFIINISPEFCPAFDITLNYSNKKLADDSPTVDRFDNTQGYLKDNVFVLSWKANRMKSNCSPEEIRKLAEWATKHEAS
jgi:ribosomal protein L37E